MTAPLSPPPASNARRADRVAAVLEPAADVEAKPAPEAAVIDEEIMDGEIVPSAPLLMRCWRGLSNAIHWVFGLACLLVGLAVMASLPLLQFLTLGYLLEASGRVARSGRLRDGFIGIHGAGRLGGYVIGAWLWLLPLRLASAMWYNAWLIDPESDVTRMWRIGLTVLTVLILGHICWAWLRGGKLRHFLWPAPLRLMKTLPRFPSLLAEKSDELWEFVAGLRIPYFFWKGLRGFAGALIWITIPTLLLIAAPRIPNAGIGVLVGLFGGVQMAGVLLVLPFLQARFAAEDRFAAFFEVGAIGSMFCRAPLAFWFALFITLLFALPLYLFKIEIIPREALWLPGLVFVTFIYPARLLTGWALSRARKREKRRFFLVWLSAATAAIPVVAIFTFVLNFTQYVSWYGAWSLFEQHAFLTPVPFLGG
ncbi:MAG: hypothetical protein KY475_13285 [Planctomycetes bacterium]|nr:hypothetical protein [Planctomycetota bacterium]